MFTIKQKGLANQGGGWGWVSSHHQACGCLKILKLPQNPMPSVYNIYIYIYKYKTFKNNNIYYFLYKFTPPFKGGVQGGKN
jgi:hypothetical protein